MAAQAIHQKERFLMLPHPLTSLVTGKYYTQI